MSFIKDLACIGLAGLLASSVFRTPAFNLIAQAQTQPKPTATTVAPTPPTKTQRRLKIELSISSPNDLKIRDGDVVTAGQILADRVEERTQLEQQRSQINLAIKKIQAEVIPAPVALLPAPPTPELPPISYANEEAAINQAQSQLATSQNQQPYLSQSASLDAAKVRESEAKRKLELQQRKHDAIAQIENLPPSVATHEAQWLKQRLNELEVASSEVGIKAAELDNAKLQQAALVQRLVDNLYIAQASLQTAKDKRSHSEYEHQITLARRVEEANQAQQQYSRQQQEYSNQKRDKEFQLAQLTQKLGEVENKLKVVAVVKSPYNGTIKNLKQTKQSDNTLLVELSLIRSESNSPRATRPGSGTTGTGTTSRREQPIKPNR